MSLSVKQLFEDGVALHRAGRLAEAAASYGQLLSREPQHAGGLRMSGILALQSGDPATAVDILQSAAAIRPDDVATRFHLGLAAQQLGQVELALAEYRTVLELRPDYLAAKENLGVVLRDVGQSAAALALFDEVLTEHPASELALANAGTLALNLGLDERALEYFETSLGLYPLNANVHLKRSQVLLRKAEFAAAWDAYEWRFVAGDYLGSNPPVSAHLPLWDGSDPTGLHLLVTAEQGIGDEIMFASCVGDLRERCAQLTLQCADKLLPLFARSVPDINLVGRSHGLATVAADRRVAIGSLPRFFRRSEPAFGTGTAYLFADPAKVAHWRERLATLGPGPILGIAWSGGLDARARQERSVALEELVLACPSDCQLLSLQYGDAGADIAALDASVRRVHRPNGLDLFDDVDGLAALLVALDGVVTVDNTIAHLAGALGVPAAVLLPVAAERRWLAERTDSVWYRSLRLLRQDKSTPGDWRGPLRALASTVREFETAEPSHVGDGSAPAQILQPATDAPTLLVNDTANSYHWGCTLTASAVANALGRCGHHVQSLPFATFAEPLTFAQLAATPELRTPGGQRDYLTRHPRLALQLERCQELVVNGEGSLHGLGTSAATLLYCIDIATGLLDKPAAIINHSCYPPSGDSAEQRAARELYSDVYARLSDVAVREPVSLDAVQSLGVNGRQVFDCLPLSLRDEPYAATDSDLIVIGGTAAVDDTVLTALTSFVSTLHSRGKRVVYLYGANGVPADDEHRLADALYRATGGKLGIVYAATEADWLATIQAASLLVSGRFHHTIAAAFLGTPFLVADSNTAKINGLLQMLGAESAYRSWADIGSAACIQDAQQRMAQRASLALATSRLEELRELGRQNFRHLGR